MALEANPETSMSTAIIAAVHSEAERLRETAIQVAVANYEKELREALGKTAMGIASYYDVEKVGQRLIITVRMGD